MSLLLWGENSTNPLRKLDTAPLHCTRCRGYWKWYLRLPFSLAGWPPLTRPLQSVCGHLRFEQTVALIEQTASTSLLPFAACPPTQTSTTKDTLTANLLRLFVRPPPQVQYSYLQHITAGAKEKYILHHSRYPGRHILSSFIYQFKVFFLISDLLFIDIQYVFPCCFYPLLNYPLDSTVSPMSLDNGPHARTVLTHLFVLKPHVRVIKENPCIHHFCCILRFLPNTHRNDEWSKPVVGVTLISLLLI